MRFLPFIFDRSPLAKLIRSIDSQTRAPGQLEDLQTAMMKDIYQFPYRYLIQAERRSSAMLSVVQSDDEKSVLTSIQMMSFRRIQRVHMESRP